jgi:hypothetical protein
MGVGRVFLLIKLAFYIADLSLSFDQSPYIYLVNNCL